MPTILFSVACGIPEEMLGFFNASIDYIDGGFEACSVGRIQEGRKALRRRCAVSGFASLPPNAKSQVHQETKYSLSTAVKCQ